MSPLGVPSPEVTSSGRGDWGLVPDCCQASEHRERMGSMRSNRWIRKPSCKTTHRSNADVGIRRPMLM